MKKAFLLVRILGVLLLSLGLGALLVQQLLIHRSAQARAEISEQIQQLLPEGSMGTTADYSAAEMPVLQIGGTDYVCLLEVPSMGLCLPIQNQWKSGILTTQPGRFWGSIYDGSLILGGGNQAGQFDFCTMLDIGDPLLLTDMQGTQFRCSVENIQRSSAADFETLSDGAYPLTLFVQEKYDGRYIIVRCDWAY